MLTNREQSVAIVCIMCLLAGNLVIKALPNTEVGGTYTYYNDQSVHNVTQATKEDENDEPTIFVKQIVETKTNY